MNQRVKVEQEPCTCVCCDMCRGTGSIHIGNQFDLDEEPCDNCSGGIVETCERCQLLIDMDYDEDAAEPGAATNKKESA